MSSSEKKFLKESRGKVAFIFNLFLDPSESIQLPRESANMLADFSKNKGKLELDAGLKDEELLQYILYLKFNERLSSEDIGKKLKMKHHKVAEVIRHCKKSGFEEAKLVFHKKKRKPKGDPQAL